MVENIGMAVMLEEKSVEEKVGENVTDAIAADENDAAEAESNDDEVPSLEKNDSE